MEHYDVVTTDLAYEIGSLRSWSPERSGDGINLSLLPFHYIFIGFGTFYAIIVRKRKDFRGANEPHIRGAGALSSYRFDFWL
jgi:hypothetical protein